MIPANCSRICVVGLGYVGLPLALALARKFEVIGVDTNATRVKELQENIDRSGEVSAEELENSKGIKFSTEIECASHCDVFIVTVPTPVDQNNEPDLRSMIGATIAVASILKRDDLVIYESTVYPGATEEVCALELEKHSRLKLNQDFHVGYSPERINPGDKNRGVKDIVKITSGSSVEAAEKVDAIYSAIVTAGTKKVSSIRVAEAAKVIENIQRDVNIALFNELAMLFDVMNLDSFEVFDAAATKWNFTRYQPGLVGGHCIGIDPYYLTYKAKSIGYDPKMILAGRDVNSSVPRYVAHRLFDATKGIIKNSQLHVLILGATFKEDCPDIRNSKSFDLRDELLNLGMNVDMADEIADADEVQSVHDITLKKVSESCNYDAIIIAVKHKYLATSSVDEIRSYGRPGCLIYDLKRIFLRHEVDLAL